MARPRKAAAAKPPADEGPVVEKNHEGAPKQDLDQYLREAHRYAEQSKEASSALGGWTNNFLERFGEDKKATAMIRSLDRMDRARAEVTMRSFMRMAGHKGLLPQPDLLDGLEPQSPSISQSAPPPPPPAEGDSATEHVKNNVRQLRSLKKLEGVES